MQTLELTGVVDEAGDLTLHVHTDFPPGPLTVEVNLPELSADNHALPQGKLNWTVFSVGALPEDFSVNREDMYDDWGR